MFRTLWKAALIVIAGSGVVGCQGDARFVKKTPTGGIVAVPGNSMLRPYYRDEAIRMIKDEYPTFNEKEDITSEYEAKVAEVTQNNERTDRFGGEDKKNSTTVKNETTTTSEVLEYRIEFDIKQKPGGLAGRPGAPVKTAHAAVGTESKTVQQAGGLQKPLPTGGVPGGVITGDVQVEESGAFPPGGIPKQTGMPATGAPVSKTPYGGR